MLSDVEFHLLIIMTCGTIYLNMHFVNEDNLSDLFKFTQQVWTESPSVVFDSLRPHGLQPARLLWPWNSPGKNTGVGSHFLLQGIFLSQEPNSTSTALQADSLPSEPPGKPQPFCLPLCIYLPVVVLVDCFSVMPGGRVAGPAPASADSRVVVWP